MDSTKSNFSDFAKLLKNYIEEVENIIDYLNDYRNFIAEHHKTCNIFKTAAITWRSTGVAVLIGTVLFSPIIGGGSLAFGATGAAMSICGGLTNVFTDYLDYKSSAVIMNDIQETLKRKETLDNNLEEQLKNFAMIIEKLMESGVDKSSAIIIAIKGIANGCIDLTKEPNMKIMATLSTVGKMYHLDTVAVDILPVIGKNFEISQKTLSFINNIFGLSGNSATVFFNVVARASSAISVAFTIVDITLLIKNWTTEHPTIEVLSNAVTQLKEEKQILSDFLEVIDASRDKVEMVLEEVIDNIKEIEETDDFEKDFEFVEMECS